MAIDMGRQAAQRSVMPRKSDARLRALQTAENLFRRQGFAATGLTQILEESGAPKGSFYHHFPEGKTQMADEALAAYADRAESLIRALGAHAQGNVSSFVRRLATMLAQEMQVSGWTLGCLLQNLSGEMAPSDPIWAARLEAIEQRWRQALVDGFVNCGVAPDDARMLATSFLSGLLGARSLARLVQSSESFDEVGRATEFALKGLGYRVPGLESA
jgi:AcrR family transcriptional regulator